MKKIMLISLALVLALGSLGVAYAMWQDEVSVTGNIETGTVCLNMTGQHMLDTSAPPPYIPLPEDQPDDFDYTCNDGFVPKLMNPGPPAPAPEDEIWASFWHLDKDVSYGSCTYAGDTVTVHLYDTYPSNFNSATVYVNNCGTVPVIITKTDVYLGGKPGPDDVPIATITGSGTWVQLNMDGDQAFELEISYGDSFGAVNQIEPNEVPPEISYWIHTLQDADQDADYTFTFVITGVQYNEG